mgnify:CR=1 FL=1
MKIDGTLRCPFCGGEDFSRLRLDGRRSVHCNGCGADGPPGLSYEDARKAWNRRPNKPVRAWSVPAPCVVCEGVTQDRCCDCMAALCLGLECDRKHAAECEPIQRDLRTVPSEGAPGGAQP